MENRDTSPLEPTLEGNHADAMRVLDDALAELAGGDPYMAMALVRRAREDVRRAAEIAATGGGLELPELEPELIGNVRRTVGLHDGRRTVLLTYRSHRQPA